MAGSKTRFGFAGDGSEPPDSEESRAARTMMGHDIHLQLPRGYPASGTPGSPTPLPPAPAAWTPVPPARVPVTEHAWAEPVPGRTPRSPGTSRLARFLGHWTRSGRFVSRSRMGGGSDEDVQLPRDTTGRNVLLVLLVAILTFLLTFAIVKLRQHFASPGPEAKQATAAVLAPTAQALHPAAAVGAPPAVPTPLPPSAQAPAKAQPTPAAPLPAAAKGLGVVPPQASPRPRKPARSTAYGADPPPHLRGELLPIAP